MEDSHKDKDTTTSDAASTTTDTNINTEVTDVKSDTALESATVTDDTDRGFTSQRSSTSVRQYVIAGGLIVIIGIVLLYGLEQQGRIHTGIFTKIQSLIVSEKAAAVVNGTKITMSKYDKSKQQIIASAQQQQLDITDPKILKGINTQAIDVLVNTELLRQAATAAGIKVTPDQIEARYQEVLKGVGGADKLTKRMSKLGITEASLRTDIEGEILIQTYLSQEVSTSTIAIDPSDVQATYDHAVASSSDPASIPPLAQVRTQIEAQLKSAKQQEMINKYIQSLKDKAKIKILI